LQNKNLLAVAGLLFGATAWGVIWYPYRLMSEAGVSGIAASFYTYSIAVLMATLLFGRHWRGLFNLPKSIVILSLIAGWSNLGYVMAVVHGEVMRVMLLFYLSPLWTLILAHYWLKEPISRAGILAIALSLVGMLIMLWKPSSWPFPSDTSDWLAISAGLCFALTNVITRKSQHLSLRAKSLAVWIGVVAMALICQSFVRPIVGEQFPTPEFFSVTQWLVMVIVAVLLVAVTLAVQYSVTQMSATRASVIFLFELVVAAVASYYLAHEAMTWNEWLGGGLIIAAALIASFNHKDN
jgi:drug/metabolite transporter (DMT)-like permease